MATTRGVQTPTPAGPAPRRRGKPGPRPRGLTAAKRKQAKTHPGRKHDEAGHEFERERWWSGGAETAGKEPRLPQTRHPRKTGLKRGRKPTIH